MTPQSTYPEPSTQNLPAGNESDQAEARRISSQEILSGHREVIVEHRGNDYRLRLTANDKLILTK